MDIKLTKNKLRLLHFAQIPCKPFIIDVKDELEANKLIDILALQHLFLFEHNIIPDYSNILLVEMWDDDIDPNENGEKWTDYYNENHDCEWEEFSVIINEYLESISTNKEKI